MRFHIENNSCAAPATVSESDLFIDLLYATELKLVWEGANLRVEKPKTHKPGDRPRNIYARKLPRGDGIRGCAFITCYRAFFIYFHLTVFSRLSIKIT